MERAVAKRHYLTVSDIWRSANQLIELYGMDAVFVAARRADDLRASGGPEYARWRRITMAILTWPSAKGNDRPN